MGRLRLAGIIILVVMIAGAIGPTRVVRVSRSSKKARDGGTVITSASRPPETQPFSVSWREGDDIRAQRYRLEGSPKNSADGRSGGVSLKLSWDDSPSSVPRGFGGSTERTDAWTDQYWAEARLILPIRVKGEQRPQVLVTWWRSDWMDYEIYAIDSGDEIRSAFGFSCRDDAAIEWIWKGGELVDFITYDHYGDPPAQVAAASPNVPQWQKVQRWSFDPRECKWVSGQSTWKPYRWGEDWRHHHVIKRPEDCPFVYRTR